MVEDSLLHPQAYSFTPIGIIHTQFRKKYDAPRQPLEQDTARVLGQEGIVTLLPHRNFEQALTDLAGFERIWLLYVFHENLVPETALPHWKPKVLPPRGRVKRGVFATRAPYRPNPIGQSVVTLKEIRGRQLFVGNCDLLDGTPILDIKPYLAEYDAFPESRAGWWDEAKSEERHYTLNVSLKAAQELDFLAKNKLLLLENIRHILERDPFPHPYHRISEMQFNASIDDASHDVKVYEIAYKEWRLQYTIQEQVVNILSCRSGFAPDSIPSDKLLHLQFAEHFGSKF